MTVLGALFDIILLLLYIPLATVGWAMGYLASCVLNGFVNGLTHITRTVEETEVEYSRFMEEGRNE